MRLLSWDIRPLRRDRDAVVTVLRECGADVFALRGGPSGLRSRPRSSALAADAGLLLLTGARGAEGLLLMARLGVEVAAVADLPLPSERARAGVAVAVLSFAGSPAFTVASVRLGAGPEQRGAGVAQLLRLFGSSAGAWPGPVVLAGDIGEPAGGPARSALAALLPDAGPRPGLGDRPDGVLCSPPVRVRAVRVLPGLGPAASSPLLAELELPSP